MRKLMRWPVLLVLFALSAAAGGIVLNTSRRFEFTDCAVGGSAAQTVTGGTYLLRITDADTFLCFADSGSTCAAGGEKLPNGTVILLTIGNGGQSVSCRSVGSVGDAIFTSAN